MVKQVTYHTEERFVLKAFNALCGAPLVRGVVDNRLSVAKIIKGAVSKCGLSDFGGDDYLEPLTVLVDSINREASLTPAGVFLANTYITADLITRLKLFDAIKKNPDIEAVPVIAPISIVGMPRTGTTFLFEMIAADPRFRVAATWEAERPFPHPEKETRLTDKRIVQSEMTFKFLNYLCDGLEAMHEIGAMLPQECIILQGPSLRSQSYSAPYSVPSYMDWLAKCDMTYSYLWHKRLVQYLQYKHRADRWVFKSPTHPGHVEDFLKVYPDAIFVQTHRPLLDVMSSISSVFCKMRAPYTNNLDPVVVGGQMIKDFGGGLLKLVSLRENRPDINDRFLDLNYLDVVSNPDGAYASFLDFAGMDLLDVGAGSKFQQNRPQHRNGTHVYKPEWFGINQALIDERFHDYNQRHIL